MGDPVAKTTPSTPDDTVKESQDFQSEAITGVSLSDVERVEDYFEGGCHPVHLGDVLDSRFEVVHKLGHGGFATVWLCFDNKNHAWRAIKIIAADESEEDGFDLGVAKLLRESGVRPSEWEACHIALPLEHFWLDGPNGHNLCLVLPLLGPRVQVKAQEEAHIVKPLLYQAAKALQLLHHHNICHGDFRPNNILLRLKDTKHISKQEMLRLLGEPEIEVIKTYSGKHPGPRYPRYIVYPATLFPLGVTNDVSVIDFGQSFHPDDPPSFLGIPIDYVAPEARFKCSPGLPSDIWSLACTIVELRINTSLFGEKDPRYVANLEGFLGPLPEPYRSVFLKRIEVTRRKQGQDKLAGWGEHIGPDGELAPIIPAQDYELIKGGHRVLAEDTGLSDPICANLASEQVVWKYPRKADGSVDSEGELVESRFKVPDDEAEVLGDLLNGIFKYDPKERLDIDDVLRHAWFEGQDSITTVSDEETCSTPSAAPIYDLRILSTCRRYYQKARSSRLVKGCAAIESQYLLIILLGLALMAVIYATLRTATSYRELFRTPFNPPRVGTYTSSLPGGYDSEIRICVLPIVVRHEQGG